ARAAAAGGTVKRSWAGRDGAAATGGGPPQDQVRGLSDVVQDLYVDGTAVWVATVDGLGVTRDRGTTWRTFHAETSGLPTSDVVAVAAREGDIWASCISIREENGQDVPWGEGLAHYDASAGRWEVIGKARGLPAEGRAELAWDILLDEAGVVWVALWNGGLGKSEDNGRTWEIIVPTDGPTQRGTHLYSLAKRGDVLWAAAELETSTYDDVLSGTFKSEDDGVTWSYYPLQHRVDGLCVIADLQYTGGRNVAWIGTAHAYGPEYGPGHGVFKSEDGGATWVNYGTREGLSSPTVYGLASAGPWLWAGTYDGVARTDDGGANWRNASVTEGLPWYEVNTVAAESQTDVWAGTNKGVAYSADSGATWRKVEITPPAGPADLPVAFAFPSPFAQRRDVWITFRYGLASGGTVTLEVYDFAGRLVKRLVDSEYRGPGDRIDEQWNGLRDDGKDAANGVYFFALAVDGRPAARGKFVILN
ncbi:MAG: hypothetical protein JSU81_02360, partial [Candidatus Coatesbacteria bacterium]